MALLRMKYGAKPRNLKHFYDRCFFSCLFLGEQSNRRQLSRNKNADPIFRISIHWILSFVFSAVYLTEVVNIYVLLRLYFSILRRWELRTYSIFSVDTL